MDRIVETFRVSEETPSFESGWLHLITTVDPAKCSPPVDAAPGWRAYARRSEKIAVVLPPTWEMAESTAALLAKVRAQLQGNVPPQADVEVLRASDFALEREREGYRPSFWITRQLLRPGTSLDAIFTEMRRRYNDRDLRRINLPAGDAVRVSFEEKLNLAGRQILLRYVNYVLVRGRTAYYVKFVCSAEQAESQVALFDTMAESLRWFDSQ